MSKKHEDAEEKGKKGKKGLVVKAALGLGLIAAGGGAAFGMMQAGVIGGHGEKEDNSPKLILKGEEDPYAPPSKEKEGEGGGDVFGEGGSKYRTIYYSFADDFTSNLKHSDALVQVSLAASTQRDGRVLLWMKKHELAIRSAMLTVLADTPEEQVYSVGGKEQLQKRLAKAINDVLKEREGFGGVDNVYFRSFIVQ
ncbi:MAG: flagellar basal body-associated FliL family protein [Novosphingobium sp.]|nr:flagellar basal body-associated FliL family protein [Novosphingobium sp.]